MIIDFHRRLALLVTLAVAISIGVLAIMAGLLLERIAALLAMAVLAILVAYLVAPAATYLQQHRVPRAVSVLSVYLLGALIVGGAGMFAVPRLVLEAGDLVNNAPTMARDIQHRLDNANTDPLLSHLPDGIRNAIATNIGSIEALASKKAGEIGLHLIEGFRSGAEGLIRGVLVLLLAFFLVTDAERITATFLRMLPANRRTEAMAWIVDIDRVVGGFVRGQLFIVAITAVAAVLLLVILHVKYATTLGLLVGIASIIPFIGPIIGTIPAIIVCATTAGPITTAILVICLVILFEIQGHVLTPIVIGRAVKVTPMVVFVAILAGAEVYGLLGTLLTIPAVGILRVALDRLFPADPAIDALVHTALSPEKNPLPSSDS